MKDDIMLGDTPKARRRRRRAQRMGRPRGRLWKHSTLAEIEGLVPDAVLDPLLAVTLVRNPWDRAVSYYHWLRAQRFDHPAVALARRLDFAEFVTHPHTLAAFRHSPAASYLARSDGRAQRRLFIRIESFAEDAAPFFAHLGFRFALPRANRSERPADYRPFYSDAAAAALARACAEDIARFGYRFDDPIVA